MFGKKKLNKRIDELEQQIEGLKEHLDNFHLTFERTFKVAIGVKKFDAVMQKVNELRDIDDMDLSLEDFKLAFEETPDAKPVQQKVKGLPPRSEYDARIKKAMTLFRQKHMRSEVQNILNISRTTARGYLKMAVSKRIVKKADYDTLNK